MAKNSCILYPEVNGKPSKLYKSLLENIKLDRPFTNLVYALYISSNAAEAMDNVKDAEGNPKYKRNSQGEHNAKDVMEFLDGYTMLKEMGNLSTEEKTWGIADSNGNRIDFTDSKEALEKADDFNDAHTGVVATVVKHGDVYHIITSDKNSFTHTYRSSVKEKLRIWDIEKQAFNSVGIDIDNLPQEVKEVFNPDNSGLIQYLKNLQRMSIENMHKSYGLILFNMDPESPEVQRLINNFGSIDAAAQALSDINHGSTEYTSGQKTLLFRAVKKCQQFKGLDLNAVKSHIEEVSQEAKLNNPDEDLKNTLHKLNKKYKIDKNEIHRVGNNIKALSEAAIDAAFVLQRQIRKLEKQQGNNAEGKRLERILNQLMSELANKRYYSGILSFLAEAESQIAEIDNILSSIPQTGTELEKAFATAKILRDIKSIRDQYYKLVSALADEHLTIDESINQEDINNIRTTARKLKDFFNAKKGLIDSLTESTMINMMTQIIGDTAPNGRAMINVIRMAAVDSSRMDFLYSIGRASNPIIAAMGSIIRNAQDSRDSIMNDVSLRIRKATNTLYKSGSDSSFMYEDDGHIISDIDWGAYKSARTAHIKSLYRQGLRGFDLKQAIEDWEEANTEDRVVDTKGGRIEKVPNGQYRKNNGLVWNFSTNKMDFIGTDYTKEQIEYYNTMMQLKGEIGTLLPAYAQKQYLPPQVRREMLDALGESKSVQDVANAFKNKVENLWKIREDDENYNMNGIIDGDEYNIVEGDFDNTQLRQIPIFFINRVQQGELLRNFSTGLAALAGTAVNYDAMNNIVDVVEFIGDFTKSQNPREDTPQADVVENKLIRTFKDLYKWSKNNNTNELIDGYISQHIYGQRQKETGKLAKIWGNIIGYTSFKGLATNIKGAVSNYLVGEFQMLIEAGAGEFYNFKDYLSAHKKLFGDAGVKGEISELWTNNMNHKATLFREMFDPLNENFSDKSHTKYYKSMFRQLVSHDCSFIGYASGEYLLHYVNMYGVLHHQKVLLNGKKIPLYDAFEIVNTGEGNSELQIKQGVTLLDGSAVTTDYLDKIRKTIRYANQTTHGAMNTEDKGLIHQRWWGRGIMNFRQWMVEHYSRRFRKRHFDASLGMEREGYWQSFYQYMFNEDTKDKWNDGNKISAVGMFLKDYMVFLLRAQSQWHNLDEMQRYNVKRVHTEMMMYFALLGLSFTLGEPEDHKKDLWRRWWIYQTKRLILDTEAGMPITLKYGIFPLPVYDMIKSNITILQSPMAGVNTLNSLLYIIGGMFNGDMIGPKSTIQRGSYKGWNRYFRNVLKYDLPVFKDWEQMQKMAEDETIFQVFKDTPSNY